MRSKAELEDALRDALTYYASGEDKEIPDPGFTVDDLKTIELTQNDPIAFQQDEYWLYLGEHYLRISADLLWNEYDRSDPAALAHNIATFWKKNSFEASPSRRTIEACVRDRLHKIISGFGTAAKDKLYRLLRGYAKDTHPDLEKAWEQMRYLTLTEQREQNQMLIDFVTTLFREGKQMELLSQEETIKHHEERYRVLQDELTQKTHLLNELREWFCDMVGKDSKCT